MDRNSFLTAHVQKLAVSALNDGKRAARIVFEGMPQADNDVLLEWKAIQDMHRRSLNALHAGTGAPHLHLSHDIFKNADLSDGRASHVDLGSLKRFEPGHVYLLNNNDIYKIGFENYLSLYALSPEAFVAVWDFDNHHNLHWSSFLAAFSDFYFPCHEHNLIHLSKFTSAIGAPVSACVIQWSRAFLREHAGSIMQVERSEEPLGKHIEYKQFVTRNANLVRLNRTFEKVGPVTAAYHNLTELDRLQEWAAHMAHWIVPTLNDMPIRVFDALITGGIPLLPMSLRHHASLDPVREHVFFYDEVDLDDPRPLTERVNGRFKEQGLAGVKTRHELAMAHGHADQRIARMRDMIAASFAPR